MENIRVLSLFSGCGGMDLGFEGDFNVLNASYNEKVHPDWDVHRINDDWIHLGKTVFNTIFANDINSRAKTAWTNYFQKKNLDSSIYHLASIVGLVKNEKETDESIFPKRVDIVTGGFPCQDFSLAGKRKGFNSDKGHDGKRIIDDTIPSLESRGQLYMWMREVIGLTQPKLFIAENVKGLINLKDVKEIIEKDFSTICDDGYLVIEAKVLQAANFGVPQSRERIFFFGFKIKSLNEKALEELSKSEISPKYDPYPPITHTAEHEIDLFGDTFLKPYTTLRQAFKGLKEPIDSTDEAQKHYSKAKYLGKGQGQKEVNLSSIGPTIRAEHHGNIEYRRLSLEHGGRNKEELFSGLLERRLTVRECARIQTFPDDYEFIINKKLSGSDAYKLIGNAVPPLLAFNIAKRIEKNWNLYFKD